MKTTLLMAVALGAGFAAGPVTAADVKTNWNTHCAKCHGADGSGNTKTGRKLGARDYRDPKVVAATSERDMIKAARGGLKDKQRELMKPFGGTLSDEEIRGLVGYIRSFASGQSGQ